jgi:glutathione S-transferase
MQLYSLATPNGQKVTIMLEELLAAGYAADYDAWLINIGDADQFGSDFVAINPNSKIPALVDYTSDSKSKSDTQESQPVRLFESGSMLLYLAEKYDGAFLPPAPQRTQVLNWLFWQMGSAPYVGGGFGHFYHYANEKQEYPIDRFTMETKRQLDVLNQQLAKNTYIAGEDYTIADMAIWPWYGAALVLGGAYGEARTFWPLTNTRTWYGGPNKSRHAPPSSEDAASIAFGERTVPNSPSDTRRPILTRPWRNLPRKRPRRLTKRKPQTTSPTRIATDFLLVYLL